MTERTAATLRRTADSLVIGPSSLHWDGAVLSICFEERGAVLGEKVRGEIRIRPETLVPRGFDLDSGGHHHWRPIATRAHVEARFRNPSLSWQGEAYVDSNFGDEPMEDRFADWQWSRAHLGRDSAVFYEGAMRDGTDFALALRFDRHGEPHLAEAPPAARLAPTKWLMPRQTRSDPGSRPRVVKNWEDAPFYSRSAVASRLWGEDAIGVHESLSLARFVHPAVQWMIPWRMPRAD